MEQGGVSARHGGPGPVTPAPSTRLPAGPAAPAPAGRYSSRSGSLAPAPDNVLVPRTPKPPPVEPGPLAWAPDVLGDGFEAAELDLGADDEGPMVATLVRSLPTARSFFDRVLGRHRLLENVDVLYVHGWSDYFFQRTMAKFWTDRGARFYALDLRKYGRSLRDGQTPGYIENLDDYDLEIGMALDAIGHPVPADSAPGDSDRKLLLFGHSTGGLVLSLWASTHPNRAHGIVLNSPWLEFQLTGAGRQLLAPLLHLGARFNLHDSAPQFDSGLYTRAQREVGPRDELDLVDERWRPAQSHAVITGWLRAILDGHARVSRGLSITAPIVMLLSARSAIPLRWDPALTSADTVLEVDEIAKASLRLGDTLTIDRLEGALHDVFLSRVDVRAEAYDRLDRWLTGWAAAQARSAAHGPSARAELRATPND
ncbi:alpha/beta hydrolase [Leucobacter sp. NPDC058333]|uniref:alpha/beta hydrolase n=1 Tax=Leucobacter sp. NPDC058333 TaxID=3346450 RepID=UPI00364EC94F